MTRKTSPVVAFAYTSKRIFRVSDYVKVLKNSHILNYFECYFIYAKVCKVYYICLFWLRDFENARAGLKVT